MKFKDWCICIAVSVLMLTVVVLVLMGIQAVVVDTGRQILGK